jgi:phosphate transport system permease protein
MPGSSPDRPAIVTAKPGIAPGLPGIWTTALATLMVLFMLVVLLWVVAVNAFAWFWPAKIWQVVLDDGTVRVGQIVGREEVPGAVAEGEAVPHRVQLKVGNREVTGADFLWVDEAEILDATTPTDLVRVVRSEYGDAFGRIVSAVDGDGQTVNPSSSDALERLRAAGAAWRGERERLEKQLERTRRPLTRREEQLDLLERSARSATDDGKREVAELEAGVDRVASELAVELDRLHVRIEEISEKLYTAKLGLTAGEAQIEVPLANALEVNWNNRMGFAMRVWHALRQGALFLVTEPREANTEGGIFPALFGTVLLVLLMSVAVVPLGVITAVYMTEYASQGWALRLANQAVNNLAGVPSIVFGMFGLAFFIYGVGGGIDRTLFADRLPTPTFGTGGVLWASLTLALLTVPVVVVATREGLLAVPRNWREGSLALGATQWQTLRRIILPAAMPGILTGLILAVSRAAGEVAPLMLTGAVKLAPSLPVDGTPPFLHLQRKFMHLGFHIYDVSMQSPNVEAAKPMAFATTLVLLGLVVLMNLTAIIVRRRLRRTYRGQAV